MPQHRGHQVAGVCANLALALILTLTLVRAAVGRVGVMGRASGPKRERGPRPEQVCALQWSAHDKELVSSHGYSHNQLILWKYPSMVKVAELTGHTSRVLHMAQSPDGTTICSAAADETLRFWKILSGGDKEKKEKAMAKDSMLTNHAMSIR